MRFVRAFLYETHTHKKCIARQRTKRERGGANAECSPWWPGGRLPLLLLDALLFSFCALREESSKQTTLGYYNYSRHWFIVSTQQYVLYLTNDIMTEIPLPQIAGTGSFGANRDANWTCNDPSFEAAAARRNGTYGGRARARDVFVIVFASLSSNLLLLLRWPRSAANKLFVYVRFEFHVWHSAELLRFLLFHFFFKIL